MIVEQVWTGNSLRNFNYLVACGETGEALAIDPLDFRRCLAVARERGWTITQILNTLISSASESLTVILFITSSSINLLITRFELFKNTSLYCSKD